ncbi:ATP-binding protein [Arenimonas sp.]|uniref:ATP-binding protein n=1 Tax=Arenimonas sp. TaxID=1872635 RepID=UPI002E32B61A|nr:ATP-binding protein [Arenimonas sp.]HEX4852837.1 ATP-binding protein [Arenimonas sp.]
MPNRPATFRYRVFNGLLLASVLVLAGTSYLSLRATDAMQASVEAASHSQQVMNDIGRVWGLLGDSESHHLRYVLTGKPDFQLEYRLVLQSLNESFAGLSGHVSDNPRQVELLTRLQAMHLARSEYSATTQQLRSDANRGMTGALAAMEERVRSGQGARLLAEMRQVIVEMNAEEATLLAARNQQRNQMLQQNWATVVTASLLALFAGLVGYAATRRMQRKAAEAFRAEMQAEQARRSSQDKSIFLASMSHEIRTPMNAIFGFTNLLAEDISDPKQVAWVDSIRKSGQALLSLINDVLDLSKMEAGKMDLRDEPTDLREIVDQTLTMFRQAAADKGIRLTAEYDGQADLPLVVDPVRVRQVLINLVSNAVKYTEHGGVIVRLACHPCPKDGHCDLRIEVADTGTGIPAHQLGQIFEPFEQGDSVDGRSREGTGLGLSIARRLVDLMGGTLRVDSTVGEGSLFVFEIPERAISHESVSQQPVAGLRVDFDRLPPLEVLVVDDVAWNRELVAAYLGGSHHRVRQAVDGLAAVEQVRTAAPDVVLMDLRMPRLSGDQALQRIRASQQHDDIPVIAVTASSMNEDEEWVRARFDGYVRKPYTKAELFEALARHFPAAPDPDAPAGVASAPEAVVEPADDSTPRAPDAAALQALEALHADLPQVRRHLRMREVEAAAARMSELATTLDWPRLARHGAALTEAAATFDLPAVKRLLETCPRAAEPRHD